MKEEKTDEDKPEEKSEEENTVTAAAPKRGFFSRFARNKDNVSQEKILEDNKEAAAEPGQF